MKTHSELRSLLRSIDHRGYPAYKSLKGTYGFPGYLLEIVHVQGDPFASPSQLSIHIRGSQTGIPSAFYSERWRKRALEDHLLRLFSSALDRYSHKAGGSGKSGFLGTSRPGQEILERSACRIDETSGDISMCFEAGFPAAGRTVLAGNLEKMLFTFLPDVVKGTLYYSSIDQERLKETIELADDQKCLRDFITQNGYIAFIADGSVLPRESGISQRPLKGAVRFRSPDSLRVEADLPHAGKVSGMAIRRGITVIAGGGYHGKSTVLGALERGVYDHIAGDGREYVVTDQTAVKIRAEDGRSVKGTDISLFIGDLPGGTDTRRFCTENASGSTSQAAGLAEALEAGSRLLLIDEDTSATNFMVRDALMLSVISRDMEPITPLLEVAGALKKSGISMILAVGSSGSWFYPADTILQMDMWLPYDITEKARKAAEKFGEFKPGQTDKEISAGRRVPAPAAAGSARGRSEHGDRKGRVKVRVNGLDSFSLDRSEVDMRAVEQIVDNEQMYALAKVLVYAREKLMDGRRSLSQIADEVERLIDEKGIQGLCGSVPVCGLARPRRQEILAAMNRWRGLKIK